jgi:hypothetical protein
MNSNNQPFVSDLSDDIGGCMGIGGSKQSSEVLHSFPGGLLCAFFGARLSSDKNMSCSSIQVQQNAMHQSA